MSKSTDVNIWGIHAGKTGDADSLFFQKKRIALGWKELGDLSKLKTRDEFKDKYTRTYSDAKPGSVPTSAGQLFRFVHEMQKDDLVVYPSRRDRLIHICRVESDYGYDSKPGENYPHFRSVKWLKSIPRTQFTQGALYEIGSAMSLFLVRNYADEFLAALEGKSVPVTPVTLDESVAAVTADIEETTRDFVLKRLAQELKGHPFAHLVAQILNTMGYRTRVSPEGADGGVDIVAHKDELGFEPPIIKVQVKSCEGSIGAPTVSELCGHITGVEFGLFVTLGTFTKQAKDFAKSRSNLRLIDGVELVNLIFQHYDQFDSGYKGLIPLKRVYVPETIKNSAD